MTQIRNDDKSFRPDRAVANAMGEPQVKQDTIETKGGAFRSPAKWYALTYRCQATPTHGVVRSNIRSGRKFGNQVAAFGLWD